MRKWDGEPTSKLEARVPELRGRRDVQKGSPMKTQCSQTLRDREAINDLQDIKGPK